MILYKGRDGMSYSITQSLFLHHHHHLLLLLILLLLLPPILVAILLIPFFDLNVYCGGLWPP